ncbi:hypothetical protein A1A1_00750 [Planococcus antarcticus DSM 14505]|uniref:Uncharacterized protein n=1 Tax=Planococcus antarcticus DSM 14505 TaxID=1185653 RepID=A0A1C7DCP8_9BACL|nr:hypothetical protein [Planococcus antarcticus]ANU09081.1 hypothetical protein BBH88_01415 [Planococcus antarcticus DSM 14505]EIM08580.1 hypothetical protein A1A1_00750 [Planococcus antarcticus DSM 14505]
MTETTSFNIGDIVATTFILGFSIIIPAIIIFIIYKIIKRSEKRANERIALERENTVLVKKQLDDMNERVMIIEKMLREVE